MGKSLLKTAPDSFHWQIVTCHSHGGIISHGCRRFHAQRNLGGSVGCQMGQCLESSPFDHAAAITCFYPILVALVTAPRLLLTSSAF